MPLRLELIQAPHLPGKDQVIVPSAEEKRCKPMTERAHVVQDIGIGIAPEPCEGLLCHEVLVESTLFMRLFLVNGLQGHVLLWRYVWNMSHLICVRSGSLIAEGLYSGSSDRV